jgi:hypothetical protein
MREKMSSGPSLKEQIGIKDVELAMPANRKNMSTRETILLSEAAVTGVAQNRL